MNSTSEHLNSGQENLKSRIELLSSVLQSSQDAIILTIKTGEILEYNPAFGRLFNTHPDELSPAFRFQDFILEADLPEVEKDMAYVWMHNSLANCEYRVRTESTRFFRHIEVSYNKITSLENQNFIALFIRDITKRKIDENALQKAKEKAEEADRLKTSFLANMSHEIRTPINAILGFADLLKEDDLEEGEQEEFINIINTNGKNLLNLINDIIDIAKIEANQLKVVTQEVNITELFSEVKESMQDLLKHHQKEHIELHYEIESNLNGKKILTDYFRLRQVLVNLIGNAIKFTEDGEIDFSVRIRDGQLRFSVSDTGIGIREEELEFIFDRFRQSDGTNIEGGTGLGLTITRNILKLMKGKIWVKSISGVGSSFFFTLPLQYSNVATQVAAQANKHKPNTILAGKNVLIVEDTETNYHLLEVIIRREQAQSIWATNGAQAVEICRNNKNIDLVLMDINLPVMDGYEATRLIKERQPDLPIIAQTAYAMAGEKAKSQVFGCDAYVSKPINPQHLLKVIKEIMS